MRISERLPHETAIATALFFVVVDVRAALAVCEPWADQTHQMALTVALYADAIPPKCSPIMFPCQATH